MKTVWKVQGWPKSGCLSSLHPRVTASDLSRAEVHVFEAHPRLFSLLYVCANVSPLKTMMNKRHCVKKDVDTRTVMRRISIS